MQKQLLLILALSLVLTGCGFNQNENKGAGADDVLAPQEAKAKAKDFITNNLLQDSQQKAEISEISEEGNLYKLKVSVGERSIDSYMTKDGEKLFPQAIDTENPPQQQQQADPSGQTPQPNQQSPQQQMSIEEQGKAAVTQAENLLNQYDNELEKEKEENIKQKIQELKDINNAKEPEKEQIQAKISEIQQALQPIITQMQNEQQSNSPQVEPQN